MSAALGHLRHAVFALALALVACESYEPFEYQPTSDIPDGPGIISGDDGEFVIYRE